MTLREQLERQGTWLFRWRSYLPLVLLPLFIMALYSSKDVEDVGGNAWEIFCFLFSFMGFILRCFTVGYVPKNTSGRNTTIQRAHTLNTTGMYSIVRHPLYVGNFFMLFGIVLLPKVWWFILIMVLMFWLYYERIIFAEEEFLRKQFGAMFCEWATKTPAFFPKFNRWRPPNLPFSFKIVLKREYSGFFGLIATFTGIEYIRDLITKGTLELNQGWTWCFLFGGIVYLILRTLRKKTSLLHVEGR
jgi:protein-S-isoprenylcysteine O-methyltransferase Ste14